MVSASDLEYPESVAERTCSLRDLVGLVDLTTPAVGVAPPSLCNAVTPLPSQILAVLATADSVLFTMLSPCRALLCLTAQVKSSCAVVDGL